MCIVHIIKMPRLLLPVSLSLSLSVCVWRYVLVNCVKGYFHKICRMLVLFCWKIENIFYVVECILLLWQMTTIVHHKHSKDTLETIWRKIADILLLHSALLAIKKVHLYKEKNIKIAWNQKIFIHISFPWKRKCFLKDILESSLYEIRHISQGSNKR